MIDLLFQIALSNVCISFALAIVATIVGAILKRPAISHLLWLLVFVKLLTPPVVMIPVIPISLMNETAPSSSFNINEQLEAGSAQIAEGVRNAYLSSETGSMLLVQGKQWLFLTWLLVSAIIFAWSLFQVYRLDRLLGKEAEAGTSELQAAAARIASCQGLSAVPTIYTTLAPVSPMVWWIGGKVWVVIPTALLKKMDTQQSEWILAHELAHVRRRDYLVRWIEWLACVCFWWNPVVWWARHNLRANEELCCDALVVSSLKPDPYIYGDSLLKAVEILAYPAHRTPGMASEINSGELLKRRITMIVSTNSGRSNLRWLQVCILFGTLIVLPLGLTRAQDLRTDKPESDLSEIIQMDRIELEALATESYAKMKDFMAKLAVAEAQIQDALTTGDISAEEAKARLKAVGLRPAGIVNEPYPTARYAAALKAAIADGLITEEYIEEKLFDYDDVQWEKFRRKLAEAVEAGKISEDQAATQAIEYLGFLEDIIRQQKLSLQQEHQKSADEID